MILTPVKVVSVCNGGDYVPNSITSQPELGWFLFPLKQLLHQDNNSSNEYDIFSLPVDSYWIASSYDRSTHVRVASALYLDAYWDTEMIWSFFESIQSTSRC